MRFIRFLSLRVIVLAILVSMPLLSSCGGSGNSSGNSGGGGNIEGQLVTADFTYNSINILQYEFTNTTVFENVDEVGVKYTWKFGDVEVVKDNKTPFTYDFPTSSTTYDVTLSVYDSENMLLGYITKQITTGDAPLWSGTVDFAYNPPDEFYSPDVVFTNTTTPNVAGLEYVWKVDGNVVTPKATNGDNVTITFPKLGAYKITLEVKDNGVASGTPKETTVYVGVFKKITSGFSRSVGLTHDGYVYSWGKDEYSQLGLGVGSGNKLTPQRIKTLPTIEDIAVGGYHTLALSDGKIYTWGRNHYGQLGLDNTTDQPSPLIVKHDLDGKIVKNIYAGNFHNLALTDDGAIYVWGFNNQYQLGLGVTGNKTTPQLLPSFLQGGEKIVDVSASNHNFVLTDKNTIYAWGNDGVCQTSIKVSCIGDVQTPQLVTALPAGETYIQVSAGALHSFALATEGRAYAWGYNLKGRLGTDKETEYLVPTLVKEVLPEGEKYNKIIAGNGSSIALTNKGNVYSWGTNIYGELGLGEGSDVVKDTPQRIPTLANVEHLFAGSVIGNIFTITKDNATYAWGDNTGGSLGFGDMVRKYSPTLIEKLQP